MSLRKVVLGFSRGKRESEVGIRGSKGGLDFFCHFPDTKDLWIISLFSFFRDGVVQ